MNILRILLVASFIFIATGIQAQSRKHTIQAGETVSSISRMYGVSLSDILKLNPTIGNGDHIEQGQVLIIPGTATVTGTTTATTAVTANHSVQPATTAKEQPQGYLNTGYKEMYKVAKKDNLYRIALLYKITIEELCEANPPLTPDSKIKKGQLLFIPFTKAEKKAMVESLVAQQMGQQQQPVGKKTMSHINVGVILPLKDGGDRGMKMVEFYQGILMAADSVKHQGTSVDIYAFHSGSSVTDIKFVLTKPELKNMDVIFGPLDGLQANALADFCKDHGIRLVMPFGTTTSYAHSNPYVYHSSTSRDKARQNAENIISNKFANRNFVILNTGSADENGIRFTSELTAVLKERGINTRTLNINGDEFAYTSALNQFRDNIIIPDASSANITASVARRLRTFADAHPEFQISILGYPEWPTYTSSLLKDFYALDTYAYCTFYRNPKEARVQHFEDRFKKNFGKEMARSFPRYGMYGFDLGYYFMHGLARLGDYFDEQQNTLTYTPFQTPFLFQQTTTGGAHFNQSSFLVHYSPNQKIEIIQ